MFCLVAVYTVIRIKQKEVYKMLNETKEMSAVYRKNAALDKAAQIIRIFSIPSLFAIVTFLIIYFTKPDVFSRVTQLFSAIFFIGIVPILAYAVHALVPSLRAKGRECQRNMAFAFTAVGYTAGLIYAFALNVSSSLKEIYLGYMVSYILLLVMNKGIKFRSSGHAAGIAGPLLYLIYFTSWITLPVCALLWGAVLWSSLRVKRHTKAEFIAGSLCSVAAFSLSIIII